MGGGGAMRAAAKVAGMSVVSSGLRSVPAEQPVAAAARRAATRPVSAIVSTSDEVNSSAVLTASHSNAIEAAAQRPCWELNDWEFPGGEDGMIGEPVGRLVFGGAPTLEEAKEATYELKDALEKVYLETKACVTSETTTVSVPQNALKAFRLLHESAAVQTVVASIASDPNVWHAVLQNEAFEEYLQAQKSISPLSDTDPVMKESVAEAEFDDHESPKSVDDGSWDSGKSADPGNGFLRFLQSVKTATMQSVKTATATMQSVKTATMQSVKTATATMQSVRTATMQSVNTTVVDMVSRLSDKLQSLFGGPTAEKVQPDNDENAKNPFADKVMGASIMGLVVMVIMVVVLKRV